MSYEILEGYQAGLKNAKGQLIDLEAGAGELGILEVGSYRLNIVTDRRAAAFTVNDSSNANTLRPETKDGKLCFGRNIPVVQGGQHRNVKYPNNHLCVLELCEDGYLVFIKMGMVTQESQAYLVGQYTNWQPRLFQKEGQVICPLYHKKWSEKGGWSTLHDVIVQNFGRFFSVLPELPDNYKLPDDRANEEEELKMNEGRVRWYEPFRGIGGFGEIRTGAGDAFCLWQQAPKREHTSLRYLAPGERVRCCLTRNPQKKAKCEWMAEDIILLP